MKLLCALLTLQLSMYLILPGHETRTQDLLSGGTERVVTEKGLVTLQVTRKREELQPFKESRTRECPTQGCDTLLGALRFLASASFQAPLHSPVPTVEATYSMPGPAAALHRAGA